MPRKLAVVTDSTQPPPRKSMTVQAAAATGDQRELLVAMRTRIAEAVGDPNTPARDLAALSRRLLEIAKELKALDAADEDDDIGRAAATADEEWLAN